MDDKRLESPDVPTIRKTNDQDTPKGLHARANSRGTIKTIDAGLDKVDVGSGPKLPAVLIAKGFELSTQAIGQGTYSLVMKAKNDRLWPGQPLACKCFNLTKVDHAWADKQLKLEMKIMKTLNHPNLMPAYYVFKMIEQAFIFMPLAEHGTVLSFLFKHRVPLSIPQTRLWFRGLMLGVECLHDHSIVHRDLKVDNFLLRTPTNSQNIVPVIADFGFASMQSTTNNILFTGPQSVWCDTCCGTADYLAPEVHLLIKGERYDAIPVDIYAMGACLFQMLNMWPPYFDPKRSLPYEISDKQLIQRQLTMKIFWNTRGTTTAEAKEMISALLNPEQSKRPTAKEVLASSFLNNN